MTVVYPSARTVDVIENVAGVLVPDPYRWLEDETEEVLRWQRDQAELASALIGDGQVAVAARLLIEQYDSGSRPALPKYAAGRWFRAVPNADDEASTVVVADQPFGRGETVIDLAEFSSDGNPAFLSWLAPSPDGSVLAIGICTDGSEHNTVRLIDVTARRVLNGAPPQVLHSSWAGGATWLPDGSGFYFFALTASPQEFQQAVYFHRLGLPGDATVEQIPIPEGSREYTLVQVSPNGRWAVASHRLGSPIPIAVRDLSDPETTWRPFVTECTGTVAGHIVGDRYIAVTDVNAPRGRVVSISLEAEQPNNAAEWTELVPEGDTVLRSIAPIGDHLYISEFDETFAAVRIIDEHGAAKGTVPLPGRGALAAPFFALTTLAVGPVADDFVFAFSTLTSSWGVYRHRHGESNIETLLAPTVVLDAELEAGWARAHDGKPIPYHVVRPSGHTAGHAAPTLISAYGAANIPFLPQYQPDMAAFVAAGGVLVQAYLRGGGEFGGEWYRGAHREKRHVRDSDLVAVAERLIAVGVTSSELLALTGGSDGGLMCGVAVTTRPDLWRVVLPREPLLDLIAGIRDPYLEFVIRKAWANPDDPSDVERLLGVSPYELIKPNVFPAVYIQAGATDPRCRPWNARKFAARLQAAQQGEAPILMHVFENAGHGAATSHDIAIAQDTEWLTFLMKELGLPGRPSRSV